MNRRMTPRVIKIIALQSMIAVVTVTVVGAAVITHDEFKSNSANAAHTQAAEESSKSSEKTTEPPTRKAEYNFEYSFAGLNPEIADVSAGAEKMLLNGDYILPENYKPTLSPVLEDAEIAVEQSVASAFREMYAAANEDGITLTPLKGYVSVKDHKKEFEELTESYMNEDDMSKKDAVLAAVEKMLLPGESEHNAGLAVDVCSMSESFEFTDEFKWLSENADDYGFILRYPKNGEEITGVRYKPWHYRYVGVSAAREIANKGITLEEYLEPRAVG